MNLPKTEFNAIICDWKRIKNHCRTTVNKEFTDTAPSRDFRWKLLISEHSPIRLIEYDWTWRDMPYWVHAELARHKFEKFISSQRDDRVQNDIPRAEKRQDAPVRFDGYANQQNLIDAFRKRLCRKATNEARSYALSFKQALRDVGFDEEADVLVPNCIYRCGCPEMQPCGLFEAFVNHMIQTNRYHQLMNISDRYDVYNEWGKQWQL